MVEKLENFENFNLALHVNDKRESVLENRSILKDYYELPSDPVWINQTTLQFVWMLLQ